MMRTLLRFLFSAIGLMVAASLLKGIAYRSFVDLLVVAVLLGALNATVGALLKALAFLPMACSFGCFSLVVNGLVFWLTGALSTQLGLGFTVTGFWPGFFGALVSSIVSSILGAIFIPKDRQRPEPSPRIKIVN